MYAGLDAWLPVEGEVINELGLRHAGAAALTDSSSPVLDWIADEGITHLAIHSDLDVLDPVGFRPLLSTSRACHPTPWQECRGGG